MTTQRTKTTVPVTEWHQAVAQAVQQAQQTGQEASLHQTGGATPRWVVVTEAGHVLIMRS